MILASAIQSINNVVNTLMRLQSRSILYTITNLFKLISVLAITLYFIVVKKMGIEGYFLAQVIGEVRENHSQADLEEDFLQTGQTLTASGAAGGSGSAASSGRGRPR